MRNTHILTLSLAPKNKEDTTPGKVHIVRHHIVAMVPHANGTTILVSTGLVYDVIEKAEQIILKGRNLGLMNEVM